MSSVQLHLILTHVPTIGLVASCVVLAYALWRRSGEVRALALVGIAVSGLVVIPALVTGNASEDVVEHLAGISEAAVDRHEDAADAAGVLGVLAALAALGTLALQHRAAQRAVPRLARAALVTTVGLSLAALVTVGWASHLGGRIRHPELVSASMTLGQDGRAGETERRGGDRDDDDDDDRRGGKRDRD